LPKKVFDTRHHVINHELRRRTGVSDIIVRIATMKWNTGLGMWPNRETKDGQKGCWNGDHVPTSVIEEEQPHVGPTT